MLLAAFRPQALRSSTRLRDSLGCTWVGLALILTGYPGVAASPSDPFPGIPLSSFMYPSIPQVVLQEFLISQYLSPFSSSPYPTTTRAWSCGSSQFSATSTNSAHNATLILCKFTARALSSIWKLKLHVTKSQYIWRSTLQSVLFSMRWVIEQLLAVQ